jgi:DNA (cytosine-5)-methyltransferase 1
MDRPRLLDLFCGAGGCSMGYHRAGFDVTGVDINPQPRYPFTFIQADVMTLDPEFIRSFDAVHASPPCQGYSVCKNIHQCQGKEYPQLIDPARELLEMTGKPYVIENVIGATLKSPIMLCGLSFGLKMFRHRLFESNVFLMEPAHITHKDRVGKNGFVCMAGNGDAGRGRIPYSHRSKEAWVNASGIDWMVMKEMAQAIPPAYTEFIGKQLMDYIRSKS